MIIQTTVKFLELKSGKKNNGDEWHLVKTLDNDDKHYNFFIKDTKKLKDLKEGDYFDITINMYYDLKEKCYVVRFWGVQL